MTPVAAPRSGGGHAWPFRAVGLASVALAWLLASATLGSDLFPGPGATLAFLVREIHRGALWSQILITLWRIVTSLVLALALGIPLGWWLGVSTRMAWLAESWVALGLALPRILILVVAFLVVGLNERALVGAVAPPTVVVQVQESVRGLDQKLHDMARVFRLPPLQIWWRVTLPQLFPVLLGVARVTLSLSWKMVVFGEVFGRTSGVGYMISFYFQQFEMRGILAYGLIMTLVLSALDAAFALTGRRAFRWKERRKSRTELRARWQGVPASSDHPNRVDRRDTQPSGGRGGRAPGPQRKRGNGRLNIAAGLLAPSSGRVVLEPGTTLAYVFQEPRLLPWADPRTQPATC